MKISALISSLQRIPKEHGDLTRAEEAPLGFMPFRYGETKVVPQYRAVRSGGIADGETVMLIRGQ